jgi:hypothetical protein
VYEEENWVNDQMFWLLRHRLFNCALFHSSEIVTPSSTDLEAQAEVLNLCTPAKPLVLLLAFLLNMLNPSTSIREQSNIVSYL